VKKSFGLLAALTAVLLAVLLLPGCPTETEAEDDNTGIYNVDGATMTWSGSWTKFSDTIYQTASSNSIERLDIAASGAGTVTIQITANIYISENYVVYGYGYASRLDTRVSNSIYQMAVTGTQAATYTYTIPSGSHWIQFLYQKNFSGGSDSKNQVTVEIISASFASPAPTTNAKLIVQNTSSFALSDVKWGSAEVSASLAPSESVTLDLTEGTGYLYFTKGSANGLKCRTQEVITVAKDETTTQTITNNTVVVDVDDTANKAPLGTIARRATRLTINNQSSFTLSDVKWGSAEVSASLAPSESTTVDVTEGTGYLYFTKGSADGLKCRTQEVIAVTKDETKNQTITNNTVVVDLDDTANAGTLGTIARRETRLTINNQSFTELTGVLWNNVSFANNPVEGSIKTGTSVSNTVNAGTGYIFFKRKSSPITARTKDMVIIAEYENKPFTFEDSTEIVEVNNQDNTGTLGALQSTVVFWDDAEGELQSYYERASFVGYYAESSDLLYGSSSSFYDTPRNGQKSIAVGGTNTAKLHLKITLSKAAKLSFWYANTRSGSSGGATSFSINEETKRTWTTDVNWSKVEYDLAAGANDLVWEKTDGRESTEYYYLTLDDILIYYTE
jgi:hypothetical protein